MWSKLDRRTIQPFGRNLTEFMNSLAIIIASIMFVVCVIGFFITLTLPEEKENGKENTD